MQRRPTLLVALGLGLLVVGLAGFHTTDQMYEYAPYAVDDVPEGEPVYRYEALGPADRDFVHATSISEDGRTGSDGFTVTFDESDDPRDLLDLVNEGGTLRSPGSYVRYNGTVYHLYGDSLAGFEFMILVPKYLLLVAGTILSVVGLRSGTALPPSVLVPTLVTAGATFGLVEWYVPDVARHLLPLAAAVAVAVAVVLCAVAVARRRS